MSLFLHRVLSMPTSARPSTLTSPHHRTRQISRLVGRAQMAGITFTPFDGLLVAGVGALGYIHFTLSFMKKNLEYITAAMISNHVPKGGARVLQIGGGTRELYYYPAGTIQVSIAQSSTQEGVLRNAGIAAKVPVEVRQKNEESLNLGTAESYDAVVLLQQFSRLTRQSEVLAEIYKVLRPNGDFIFINKDQELIMKGLQEQDAGFQVIQTDVALQGKDDHLVGIARKQKGSKIGFSEN